jgi:hypothetical protein
MFEEQGLDYYDSNKKRILDIFIGIGIFFLLVIF